MMRCLQRIRRHRLAEKLVDAEADGLDHALALDMPGQHDDRHIRMRELARRAQHAHEFAAGQLRHFPVEHDDVGNDLRNGFEPVDAVGGLMHVLDADREQQAADHLAHVIVVVDQEHLGGGDQIADAFQSGLCDRIHGTPHARHRSIQYILPSIFAL